MSLEAGRDYAAVLEGIPWAASEQRVIAELSKAVRWSSLRVYQHLHELPATWPAAREDASGRRWALATPASAIKFVPPPQLAKLWVRR